MVHKMVHNIDIEKMGWDGDFDGYRREYKNLCFEDLKQLYGIWYQKYPEQKYYDVAWYAGCLVEVLMNLREPIRVIELGGYNGELALDMFKIFNLFDNKIEWTNVEIIPHSIVEELRPNSLNCRYKYKEIVLQKQLWEEIEDSTLDVGGYDIFISGDTIEHFCDDEVRKLFNSICSMKIPYLSMKIPVKKCGQRWEGRTSAHLANMGSDDIKLMLEKNRYELVKEKEEWTSFWKLKI